MAKRPTTITYIDNQTGRLHTINAQVAAGATRTDIREALTRTTGLPTARIRITRVTH